MNAHGVTKRIIRRAMRLFYGCIAPAGDGMDIRQLKRFIAVAELGSFSKAADLLAISQPSLSRSIQMLEESLSTFLFERGARGIVLTPVGNELLPHARAILNERDRAVAAIQSLHNRQYARIAIGAEPSFSMQRLPTALAEMAASHPDVQIIVKDGNLNEMLNDLREGALSFVLGSRAPYADTTDVDFEELWQENASVLMRADHPLSQTDQPSWNDLAAARWIVADHPATIEGWSKMFLNQDLPVPTISIRTSSVQLVKGCLLQDDYVSLGDHSTYRQEIASGQLISLDFGQPRYQRPAGIFRRCGVKLSANERALWAALRSTKDHPN